MFKFQTITPTRVDLAGGTLDLWPIHNIVDRKATVNIGVSLTATTTVSQSSTNQYSISSKDQNIIIRGGFDAITAYPNSLPLLSLLVKAAWSKNLPPIDLETFALSPAGAGLGGSSCLAVSAFKLSFLCSKQY